MSRLKAAWLTERDKLIQMILDGKVATTEAQRRPELEAHRRYWRVVHRAAREVRAGASVAQVAQEYDLDPEDLAGTAAHKEPPEISEEIDAKP